MKPIFHPQLVNDPFGDPALYIEFLFEKRALMFDLGDIQALAPRKILRLSHIFISHTHMDHFIGFDHILRICLGRDKCLHLYGPAGLIDQVEHRLGGYTWNLVQNYDTDFTIIATEFHDDGHALSAHFHCQQGFKRENQARTQTTAGMLLDEDAFQVRAVHLDHKIPCLAFALEEKQHINVWKSRLDELGLPTGAWLQDLKKAVLQQEVDDKPFRVWWRENGNEKEKYLPLAMLKEYVLRIVPGQKIVYVVDAVYHLENERRILELATGADLLFIETSFLHKDVSHAVEKYHLTARQAGELGRKAKVKRLIPFHFSVRHTGMETDILNEVREAFGRDLS